MIIVSTLRVFRNKTSHTEFFFAVGTIKFIAFNGVRYFRAHFTLCVYDIRAYNIIRPIMFNRSIAMRTKDHVCKQFNQPFLLIIE